MTTPPVTNPDLGSAIERALQMAVDMEAEPMDLTVAASVCAEHASDLRLILSSHEEQKAENEKLRRVCAGRNAIASAVIKHAKLARANFATAQARIEALEGGVRTAASRFAELANEGAAEATVSTRHYLMANHLLALLDESLHDTQKPNGRTYTQAEVDAILRAAFPTPNPTSDIDEASRG